jgi:hypothetical protein
MKKKKGKPGRKPTGKTPVITLRLSPTVTAMLDHWAAKNKISRSDAIRRLIVSGLVRSKRSNASELAGRQIDRLTDSSVSSEQKAHRKARLLKGPEEFREIRGKAKKAKQ